MPSASTPRGQLDSFIEKFSPQVAAIARHALRIMEKRLPGATRIVYDNYNALAIGFGPSDRASDAVFSIAVFPRWVSLFFFQGVALSDPDRLLKGTGTRIRHIVLNDARELDLPAIRALMKEALAIADPPIPAHSKAPLIIRSVSAKQRPRRPSKAATSRDAPRRP
jgi:Domain of unknown function (DU1801)